MNGNLVLNLQLREQRLLPTFDYVVAMTFTVVTGFLSGTEFDVLKNFNTEFFRNPIVNETILLFILLCMSNTNIFILPEIGCSLETLGFLQQMEHMDVLLNAIIVLRCSMVRNRNRKSRQRLSLLP